MSHSGSLAKANQYTSASGAHIVGYDELTVRHGLCSRPGAPQRRRKMLRFAASPRSNSTTCPVRRALL